jgi:hypothetical protein
MSSIKALETSSLFPTILEETPFQPITNRRVSILGVVVAQVPLSFRKRLCLPSTIVRGLPIPRIKRQQEQYRLALRVQCVTLYKARIPLNIICS